MKSVSILEGRLSRLFSYVGKMIIRLASGGEQEWIPQDEAGIYINRKNKKITENGTYLASDDNCDAFDEIEVELPVGHKTITQDGTYRASDDNFDGYLSVNVVSHHNVGAKEVTANGEYVASADGLEGYSVVYVKIPEKKVKVKRIEKCGQYLASSDNVDGYSVVNVEVPQKPATYPSGREVTGIAERDLKDFETVMIDTSGENNTIDYATKYPRGGSGKLLGVMKGSCDEGDEGIVIVLFE